MDSSNHTLSSDTDDTERNPGQLFGGRVGRVRRLGIDEVLGVVPLTPELPVKVTRPRRLGSIQTLPGPSA
jgi:hypothetical protein